MKDANPNSHNEMGCFLPATVGGGFRNTKAVCRARDEGAAATASSFAPDNTAYGLLTASTNRGRGKTLHIVMAFELVSFIFNKY